MFQYKVNSDREFFEEFHKFSLRIKSLAAPFQNQDAEMTAPEVAEWDSNCQDLMNEIQEFLKEAGNRIVLK